MRAAFLANVYLDKNEGIYKKIHAEAAALGNTIGKCDLMIGDSNGHGCRIVNMKNGRESTVRVKPIKAAISLIRKKNYDVLYIRLMIPGPSLLRLMSIARKKGVKVFYEIPTYPYYAEQIRTSRKKYRALAKIAIDAFFSPFVYRLCSYMPVIKSNSGIKMKPQMVEITNGAKVDDIKAKAYPSSCDKAFRMVTVGTLYPYHGYDRVLKGLKACNEKVDGKNVEFHVIGNSDTINDLKAFSKELGLERVFFHGTKTTEELNEMFESFDVGLGCLALHRRNADIDTTLKIIEYYCRGVPVVTSGISPLDKVSPDYTIHVVDNETPINIARIVKAYEEIDQKKLQTLSTMAKRIFDWNYIMKDLMRRCQ